MKNSDNFDYLFLDISGKYYEKVFGIYDTTNIHKDLLIYSDEENLLTKYPMCGIILNRMHRTISKKIFLKRL